MSTPAPPAIFTQRLTKSYGPREVLHPLDLIVPRGSLFGFLGPNGAGKTTAIRILLGLLRASSGSAQILGRDAWRDGSTLRAEVGYLPGDVRFYNHMSGRRTLQFFAAARGGRGADRIDPLAERLGLELDKRVRRYSRGMKQKLGLIQALMHEPRVLILDEPTTSLDPLVRLTLYEELRRAAAAGRTVLFSSHTLSEVEELCDHVAILRDGLLVAQERIEVLRCRALRHVQVRFAVAPDVLEPPPELRVQRRDAAYLAGAWSGPVEPLVRWLAQQQVDDVAIGPPELEDLFLTYYQDVAADIEPAAAEADTTEGRRP